MKKTVWLFAMAAALVIFLFSPFAGFELVFFIDAIGFDVFAMLFEVQMLVFLQTYTSKVKQACRFLDAWLMERDINYFIPSRDMIKAYPPIIIHAVPGIIGLPLVTSLVLIRASQDSYTFL